MGTIPTCRKNLKCAKKMNWRIKLQQQLPQSSHAVQLYAVHVMHGFHMIIIPRAVMRCIDAQPPICHLQAISRLDSSRCRVAISRHSNCMQHCFHHRFTLAFRRRYGIAHRSASAHRPSLPHYAHASHSTRGQQQHIGPHTR